MTAAAVVLAALPAVAFGYAYAGYPLLLWIVASFRGPRPLPEDDPDEWPTVSVALPAYNEEGVIGDTLERLLALDYPADRLQIVVVSDASSDRTDEIVRSYAHRGVELVRLEERSGKTAAENAAVPHLRGEIVVNTDATTRLPPGSLKPLVRAFRDPSVGVASGRDRSVGREAEVGGREADAVRGESGYVGWEMWLRELETRVHSIVGASGCFYAIRRELHREPVPGELSRDFMAALRAREAGYRAVSVPGAVAGVPRARSLRAEHRRKTRTMVRGLTTLWRKRHLLNPLRWGSFAWMLFSHKLARWLVPATLPGAVLGLGVLAAQGHAAAGALLGAGGVLALAGLAALRRPEGGDLPAPVATAGYLALGLAAGVVAWARALGRQGRAVWEPTRR